ncbi:MAG TPA: hypothetical protein VGE13_04520 [Candidatus Saccharimonadales bacterium]
MPAHGVEGINKTIGFQGRLQSANGGIVADGYYNMQFKIYQDGAGTAVGNPGGTLKWTESYINNGGTSGVRVKNGYFSVDLGSRTAFGTSVDWNQDTLWISMNIAGSNTSCTTFGSAPCASDGEMLPMKQLTATPYALNADKLDGKDASDFIQNQNSLQQTATNFWISGTGRADTLLQAPALDTASGVALNIGTTNATSINLNQNVTIAANKDLTFGAGSGSFDQSLSTGTLKTGTGAISLNGDTTVANGKMLTVNGTTLVKPAGGSANALQVQDAAGGSTFNVATSGTGPTVTIGNTSTNAGSLGISDGSGNTAVISTENLSQDRTYTLPDEDGTICLQNSANCGFLQNQNSANQAAHFRISGTGSISSDSSNAFSVQDASGTKQLNVDNTNNRVTIGTSDTTGTTLVLDTKTSAGDPAGVNGAMYYSSDSGRFRCYEDGKWKDCITPLPVSAKVESDVSNSTTSPIDISDLSFSLDANTKYYYKFVIIHESAASTTGIGFGVTTPTDPVSNHWCVNTTATLSSATPGTWGAYCGTGDASATTTGVQNSSTAYTSTMEGYIETDTDGGDLKLRMKSGDTAQTTVKAGSFGILQIVQ